jgi:hypothetical protein
MSAKFHKNNYYSCISLYILSIEMKKKFAKSDKKVRLRCFRFNNLKQDTQNICILCVIYVILDLYIL